MDPLQQSAPAYLGRLKVLLWPLAHTHQLKVSHATKATPKPEFHFSQRIKLQVAKPGK